MGSQVIPPLPPGFTLDTQGGMPPLPAGFTLDAPVSRGTPLQQLDALNGARTPEANANPSLWERISAGANSLAGMAQNSAIAPLANIAGVLMPGGTAEENAAKIMARFGRQPQSPLEAQYTQNVGNALNDAGVNALPGMAGEISAITRGIPQAMPAARAAVTAVADSPEVAALKNAGGVIKNAGGAVLNVPGKVASETAGMLTGVGPESFRQAFRAGREGNPTLAANMRGQVPIEQVLTDAKQGLSNIQDANQAAYRTAKTGWSADPTTLDFAPIDSAFKKLEDTLNVNGHSMIGSAESAKVAEVGKILDEWRSDPSSHTTLGLDALKRRLDAVYPDNYNQTQAQRVITGTRNAVKDAIVQQTPEYADAMKNYETQLGTIREIQQALSLGKKAAADTALRKLQSLSRNNVNTNYGYRQGLADQLKEQGGVDVMPAVAGQSLSSWAPRGLARLPAGAGGIAAALSNPVLAPLLSLTSPRLMGEAALGMGRLSGLMKGKGQAMAPVESVAAEPAMPPLNTPEATGPLPSLPNAPPVYMGSENMSPAGPANSLTLADLSRMLEGQDQIPMVPGQSYSVNMTPTPLGGGPTANRALSGELLSLSDLTNPKASGAPVESMNFPLRQEVLQQPEIAQAIDAFRSEQTRLQAIIDNKGIIDPRVKRNAAAELQALQDNFAAGMKQLGIQNAQDAHGLSRPLYQSGTTQLPIQRTFSK